MKKLLFALALGLLLVLAFATVASADNGPHGGFNGSTDACASCHRAHSAISSDGFLLVANDVYELCISCHDGTGAFTNVVDGYYDTQVGDPGKAAFAGGWGDAGVGLFGGGFVNTRMLTDYGNAANEGGSLALHSISSVESGVNSGMTCVVAVPRAGTGVDVADAGTDGEVVSGALGADAGIGGTVAMTACGTAGTGGGGADSVSGATVTFGAGTEGATVCAIAGVTGAGRGGGGAGCDSTTGGDGCPTADVAATPGSDPGLCGSALTCANQSLAPASKGSRILMERPSAPGRTVNWVGCSNSTRNELSSSG